MNLILLFNEDFIDKGRVCLKGRRAQHLLSVNRCSVGDSMRVGIENGDIGTGLVINVEKVRIELEVTLRIMPPPPIPLTLLLALPRPKALKRIIQAATAMGVKKIFILGCRHVEKSYWSTPVLTKENLRRHMILGLEQAQDTVMPRIQLRQWFKPFVEDELKTIAEKTTALVAQPDAGTVCPRGCKNPVTLAIGPERGFIPYEIEKLKEVGFTPVSLGPRILRVEHAVPALIGRMM
ncbi:MAG: 16S rRNA (uracil(1498)-N(3))-methyltransferase [Chitinivibrionales bacterium]|nr:16S rRNA (uracil(1498)-N(3))-methyltransferase [Chitinivibrionales bacterium]